MGIRLFLEESDGSRRNLDLDAPVVVIGRGADNEVVLKDQRSSRKHCRISETPHGVVLEDLKSANGTILNGKPVSRTFLKPGDEFRVGNARLVYRPDESGLSGDEGRPSSDAEAPSAGAAAPGGSGGSTTTVVKGRETRARTSKSGGKPRESAREESLTCIRGPLRGKTFPIGEGPFLLGRKSDCDVRLADKRISSHHARVVRRGEELLVEDLESTNGILVDGRKVTKARLVTGSRLALGGFVFEAKVPGTRPRPKKKRRAAGAAESQGPPGTEPVDELALGRVDVERFFAQHRFAEPLITGALVLIIGLLSYFAIDIARRVLIEQEVDPRSPENRIVRNWSFEELPGEGDAARAAAVPGWRLGEGDQGELRVTRELAQYPGSRALELVATGDEDLCAAVHAEPIAVVRGTPYTLKGFVGNRGAFIAGFLVEWLERFGEEAQVVSRSFSECVQIPDGTLDVEETVEAPTSATHARVSCVIYGRGASAIFDRVSFAAGSNEDGPGPGGDADADPDVRFALAGRGEGAGDEAGFTLSLLPGGVFSLAGDLGEMYPAFWASVGGDRDLLAIGPRLARPLVRSGDRGSIHVTTYVPDLAETRWVTLESTVRVSGAEASLDWQVTAPSDEPRAVALYWLSRQPSLPVLVHGSSSREMRFSEAGDPACEELVFGERRRRVSFSFPAPLVLESRRHPGVDGAWLLIARSREPGTLRVGVAAGSRREKEAALATLKEAGRLFQTGAVGEARKRLTELPRLYPEQTNEIALAREMLASWREDAERELASYRAAIDDFRRNPMPAVYRSLVARGKSWAERLQGTPEGSAFEGAVADLVRHRETVEKRRREEEHAKLLAEAREHFQKRRYGLCELNLRWLLEAGASGEVAREAGSLIESVAERRKTVRTEILFR